MRAAISFFIVGLVGAPAQASPLDVSGTWIAPSRYGQITSHVRISDCGDGTPCGHLVWLDPAAKSAKFDERNLDRALRRRPLLGTPILTGFKRHDPGWQGGTLYNPEDGKSFASRMALGSDGRLWVTGCLGPLCRTKAWSRLK